MTDTKLKYFESIAVENRKIGKDYPVFIIAELHVIICAGWIWLKN